MAEQELDRNEAASSYKLEQARQRGTVMKSADLLSAIVFAVAAVYAYWRGWPLLLTHFRFEQTLLQHANRLTHSPWAIGQLLEQMMRHAAQLVRHADRDRGQCHANRPRIEPDTPQA
jgi:flagellar biosynthetic protein FlhB